jgi:hypothetical protein
MLRLLEHSANSSWIRLKQKTPLFNLVSFIDGSWEGRKVFNPVNFHLKRKPKKANPKQNPKYKNRYVTPVCPLIVHQHWFENLYKLLFRSLSTIKKRLLAFR